MVWLSAGIGHPLTCLFLMVSMLIALMALRGVENTNPGCNGRIRVLVVDGLGS